MTTRILLVEDEGDLRFSLVHNLEFENYEVVTAENGEKGLKKALEEKFDLILNQ
jgi:DNA-binding response OmpR family regulator